MKYHLLPISKFKSLNEDLTASISKDPSSFGLTRELNPSEIIKDSPEMIKARTELLAAAKQLKEVATKCYTKEKTTFLKDLVRTDPKNFKKIQRDLISNPSVYCLYDKESMQNLVGKLKHDDTVVLHGEGQPFLVGLASMSKYDLDAVSFAQLLNEAKFPDDVNIELYTCLSAVNYIDGDYNYNFARDTSEALHYLHGYKNIHVSGFAGLIVDKENGKFSVSKTVKRNPGDHLSIDAARITYLNGEKTKKSPEEPRSTMSYDWATAYIQKAKIGKDIIKEKKSNLGEATQPADSIGANSFCSGSTQIITDGEDPSPPPKI